MNPRLSIEERLSRLRKCRDMIRASRPWDEIRSVAKVTTNDIAMQRRLMAAAGEVWTSLSTAGRSHNQLWHRDVADQFSVDLVEVFTKPRTSNSISYFNNFD